MDNNADDYEEEAAKIEEYSILGATTGRINTILYHRIILPSVWLRYWGVLANAPRRVAERAAQDTKLMCEGARAAILDMVVFAFSCYSR